MARLPISEESRHRLYEGDPRWTSKAVLRLLSTFFAFFATILFAVCVSKTVRWENVWNSGYGNDWTDAMPLAPVCLRFALPESPARGACSNQVHQYQCTVLLTPHLR